jgi:peroxiredoxin
VSRRNTYLLGGLAVIAGIALVVIAIAALSSGDGDEPSPGSERTAPETPVPTSEPPPPAGQGGSGESSGATAEGGGIRDRLARRRLVRAPDFSARVIGDGTPPGRLAAAFSQARSGDSLQLSKLRGTPVVLHLWSSRCAPCRTNSRVVEAAWKRWAGRGVLFVGVHVEDSDGSATAAIRQYRLTYPAVFDGSGQVPERYGAAALPQTFFISAGGDIVGEVAGSPSVRQLEVGAAAARSGEPFGSEQGSSRIPIG